MNRRNFLTIAGSPLRRELRQRTNHPQSSITHAHFYDPSRPGGVPWPPKDEERSIERSFPPSFERITAPLGVKGVIKLEASPLLEDNQWVLDLAAKSRSLSVWSVTGAGKADFGRHLERFRRTKVSWYPVRKSVGQELRRRFRQTGIHQRSQAARRGRAGDGRSRWSCYAAESGAGDGSCAWSPDRDRSHALRCSSGSPRAAYQEALREIGTRKQVYCKVSSVLRRSDGRVPEDVDYYRPRSTSCGKCSAPVD